MWEQPSCAARSAAERRRFLRAIGRPDGTEAHHLKEVFTENEPTDVNEMVLGCSTDDDYLHHKGWTYVGSADDLYLRHPTG